MIAKLTLRRTGNESGFAAVTVALSLTAMLIVTALVLDGGQNYSVRRRMQNAADSSAMAGAQALYKYQFQGGSASAVMTAAQDAANRNGHNGTFECTVVQFDGNPVAVAPADCSNTSAVTSSSASGVKVVTQNNRNLSFGGFVGQTTQGVRANAAATVQPLLGGPAPFLICGNGPQDTGGGGYDILRAGNPPTVDTDGALQRYGDPLVYHSSVAPIAIQENKVPDCGAPGGSFDGKGDGSTAETGSWVSGNPGNGSNNHAAYEQVVSAKPCPDPNDPVDCELLIPIIDQASGSGSHVLAHIVAWTVWHMQPGHGNTKFEGWFLGAARVTAGAGQAAPCTVATPTCVVKLRA